MTVASHCVQCGRVVDYLTGDIQAIVWATPTLEGCGSRWAGIFVTMVPLELRKGSGCISSLIKLTGMEKEQSFQQTMLEPQASACRRMNLVCISHHKWK